MLHICRNVLKLLALLHPEAWLPGLFYLENCRTDMFLHIPAILTLTRVLDMLTSVTERRPLWSFCGSKTCWKCPGQHSESGQPALAFYGSGFAIACYGLRVCHRLPPLRVEGFPPTGFAVHFLLFEHIFQVCYCASLHRVPNIAFWGLPPTGFPLFRLMV